MKKLKQIFKSKTINYSLLITILGIIELNFNLIATYFGEHQGFVFILISICTAILRFKTTEPLQEK
jgi:hypothetical protein